MFFYLAVWFTIGTVFKFTNSFLTNYYYDYFPYTLSYETQTYVFQMSEISVRSHKNFEDQTTTVSYQDILGSDYSSSLVLIYSGEIQSANTIFFALSEDTVSSVPGKVIVGTLDRENFEKRSIKKIEGLAGEYNCFLEWNKEYYVLTVGNDGKLMRSSENESNKIIFDQFKSTRIKCINYLDKLIFCAAQSLDSLKIAYGSMDKLNSYSKELGYIGIRYYLTVGMENKIYIYSFSNEEPGKFLIFGIDENSNKPTHVLTTTLKDTNCDTEHRNFFMRYYSDSTLFVGCKSDTKFIIKKIYFEGQNVASKNLEIEPTSSEYPMKTSSVFDFIPFGVNMGILIRYSTSAQGNKKYSLDIYLHKNFVRPLEFSLKEKGIFTFEFLKVKELTLNSDSSPIFKSPKIQINNSLKRIMTYSNFFYTTTSTELNVDDKLIVENADGLSDTIIFNYRKTDTDGNYENTLYEVTLNIEFTCYETCSTCYGGLFQQQQNCITCKDEFNKENSNCIKECSDKKPFLFENECYKDCPIYTVENKEAMICKYCDGTMLFDDGQCVEKCPEDKIKGSAIAIRKKSNKIVKLCKYCDNGMLAFDGNCVTKCPSYTATKENMCEFCGKSGKFLLDGVCVDDCPENKAIKENNVCEDCDEGKFVLNGACVDDCPENKVIKENNVCEDCDEGKFVLNGACVDNCPEYTVIKNNVCVVCEDKGMFLYDRMCIDFCPEYSVVKEHNLCVLCKNEGTYYFNDECLENCPVETYKDNQRYICKECKEVGKVLVKGKGCEYKCPDDLPINEDGVCAQCKYKHEEGKGCYDEIPLGYFVEKSNPSILKKCLFLCGITLFPKEKKFCERKDIINNCYIIKKIDKDLKLNTDLFKSNTEQINDYINKTNEEKASILEEVMKNLTKDIQKNLTDGIQQSILLNELLKETENKTEIKKYLNKNLESLKESLTCDNIKELFEGDINNTFLVPSLGVYYSLLDKEKYFSEKQYEDLQVIMNCIVEEGLEYLDIIHDGLSTDYLSISASSTNKMINIITNLTDLDKDFDEMQFKNNLTYKYKKAILPSESVKNTKKIIDNILEIASSVGGDEVKLKYSNLEFLTVPAKRLLNENYISDGLLISISSCPYYDNKHFINQMIYFNLSTRICIPYSVLEDYPEIEQVAIVNYGTYPLLNMNVTDEINKEFNAITLRDKNGKEIDISNLSTPIKITRKKANSKFKFCIFYDEEKEELNSTNCETDYFDDNYIICSCNHLTDFSISNYDPVKLFKDIIKLFSQARIITDFKAFSILNPKNAIVLYLISGILFIYFILLAILLIYDFKTQDDFFIMVVNKKSEECCSLDKEKEEEFQELNEKMFLWLPDAYEEFEGYDIDENGTPNNGIEMANIQYQYQYQYQYQMTKEINSPQKRRIEHIIEKKNSIRRSNTKKSPKRSCCSGFKIQYVLFKEFFKKDYWICTFFNSEKEMIKVNVLTIFVVHLIASLAVCSIFAECGIEDEIKDKGFNNRDLAVSVATILILEIPFTFFEVMLCKSKVNYVNTTLNSRARLNACHRYVIIYFILAGIVVFSIINTTWISLDSELNNLGCRFITDFFMSAIFDCFVFQLIILVIKAFIYLILLRQNKSSFLRASLFCFVSSLPWIFNL